MRESRMPANPPNAKLKPYELWKQNIVTLKDSIYTKHNKDNLYKYD